MSTDYAFTPPTETLIPVEGSNTTFPVRRIYCVGRNYAEHAREMGSDPDREPPFFFSKPRDAIVPQGGDVPFPPATDNLQHEVELVVAIGRGGRRHPRVGSAHSCVRLCNGYRFHAPRSADISKREMPSLGAG